MSQTLQLSREEMRAVYAQGEDAVYDFVVSIIQKLEARIQALEDRLDKDSHNSSKPPSSDGLKKPVKSRKRHPSSKKAGGQTGHVGARWGAPGTGREAGSFGGAFGGALPCMRRVIGRSCAETGH